MTIWPVCVEVDFHGDWLSELVTNELDGIPQSRLDHHEKSQTSEDQR
jgi:hypothetical protein